MTTSPTHFELSVPAPASRFQRPRWQLDPALFQGSGIRYPGLVLGLFVASEIARAHGGSPVVDSTTKETRFSFLMTLESVAARHGTFLLADG